MPHFGVCLGIGLFQKPKKFQHLEVLGERNVTRRGSPGRGRSSLPLDPAPLMGAGLRSGQRVGTLEGPLGAVGSGEHPGARQGAANTHHSRGPLTAGVR